MPTDHKPPAQDAVRAKTKSGRRARAAPHSDDRTTPVASTLDRSQSGQPGAGKPASMPAVGVAVSEQGKRPSRAADLPPCTLYRLRMATRRATRLYDRMLAPTGLGIAQFGVLNAIRARDGATVTEIARRLDMERTTLTRNLRPLMRAGLVAIDGGSDARSRALRLTPAGGDALSAAFPFWRQAQQRVAASLGESETAALNALLADALDRLPDV